MVSYIRSDAVVTDSVILGSVTEVASILMRLGLLACALADLFDAVLFRLRDDDDDDARVARGSDLGVVELSFEEGELLAMVSAL